VERSDLVVSGYRHPTSYRPPLAFGGHCWLLADRTATCHRCAATVPTSTLHGDAWAALAGRYCLAATRALPAGGGSAMT
jgi:hypothetical protein